MFDLEQSIADWRKQMLAAGIKMPVPLEELEIHLRDDIEQQMKSGLSELQAFDAAKRQLGRMDLLQNEFKKTDAVKHARLQKWLRSVSMAFFGYAILFGPLYPLEKAGGLTLVVLDFCIVCWKLSIQKFLLSALWHKKVRKIVRLSGMTLSLAVFLLCLPSMFLFRNGELSFLFLMGCLVGENLYELLGDLKETADNPIATVSS